MIDHRADLEADFLRFYRLDIEELDGPQFMRLAWRVSTYGGVMHMRLQQQRQRDAASEPRPPAAAPAASRPASLRAPAGSKQVRPSQFAAAHPDLMAFRKVS